MAQLTPQGYRLKPFNQWFLEERALYTDIDPQWNLDPSTPDGLKIAHDAEIFSALDETLMEAYNSKDPNKARGINLDFISAITGTFRSRGTPSGVDLLFSGVAGSNVFRDTVVESATTGSRWITTQSFVLDVTGRATVPAICLSNGPVEADTGTLTRLITVLPGVTAVTNPGVATPGTDEENDSSLRIKRETAVGRPGSNQISSIYGAVFALPGVRHVRVYENPTGSAAIDPDFNPHGLPDHSMAILVDGGDDAQIAYAIYLKKNPGCFMAPAGTPVVVLVQDEEYPTNTQNIRFNRPSYVDMVLEIELKDPEGVLPANIEDLIREAFMEYANGELTQAACGFRNARFDIGESVPYSSMYTPINKVIGPFNSPYVESLLLNGVTANKVIAFSELSRWTESNISVSVVP